MASSYMLSASGKADTNAAAVTRAQWERYQQIYTGVEDTAIRGLTDNDSKQVASQALAATERTDGVNQRQMARLGATNTDADIDARRAQINQQQAAGGAYNNAEQSRVDLRMNTRNALIGQGQSLVNQATGGLAAASSAQQQREAFNDSAKANAKAQKNAQTGQLVSAGLMAAAMFM